MKSADTVPVTSPDNNSPTSQVQFVEVEPDLDGQRIDNFLRTFLKGVPKSLIYRILRKGEVRVNKKRVKPEYKLVAGDLIRVPPVRVSETPELPSPKLEKIASLEQHILFEDSHIIVFNKPSGLAVHGGSGLSFGLIEGLRPLILFAFYYFKKSVYVFIGCRERRPCTSFLYLFTNLNFAGQ